VRKPKSSLRSQGRHRTQRQISTTPNPLL